MALIWRLVALEDLDEAHRYIGADNSDAADHVRTAILAAAERLTEYPSIGKAGRVDETRELVVPGTPYTLAYTVTGEDVMIVAVLHGAQEWPAEF